MTLSTVHDKGRRRRTRDELAQLDRQILEVLREDNPQSVRHVFYRMTDPRLRESVEKSDAGYRHVQYRIAELRRAGRLPYGWISDATRRGYFVHTFASRADFIRRMAGLYRGDLWRFSDTHIEVWCESRSLAGVLQDDCEELAVPLYPCGGFSSITLAYDAASLINAAAAHKPRGALIYYIGDYDAAGVLIDVALERELRKHLDSSIDMRFVRLGINESQVLAYDLPTKPRKKTDKRALHVAYSVEAEALPAATMRSLLREAVESHLPQGAL